MKTSSKTTLALILISSLATVLIAYAATQIWSNTVTITPVALPTLTLTANTTTPMVTETVKFTATLSNSASGVIVNFYRNGTWIGSNSTVNGVCTFNLQVTTTDVLQVNASCTI